MHKKFKIGEISRLYHIGVDSLRYYEEIGIIKPERSESGYRLYSEDDIWSLNVIRDLRELGFGMETIKEYMQHQNVDTTLKLLEDEKQAITAKMRKLVQLSKNVEKRIKNIQLAENMPLYEITVKKFPDRRCYMIEQGYSKEQEMDILIKELVNMGEDHLYIIGNNQIGSVIPLERDGEDDSNFYKSVFVIDREGEQLIPGGSYLSVCYKGRYEQSRLWAEKLREYADENSIKLKGDILELLWIDLHTSHNIEEHITELQVLAEQK